MGFEYFILIVFLVIILILVLLIPVLSSFAVYQQNYQEKITPYECGFDPMESSLAQFEIRYYLLAILFLIFDLEVAYFLPWILVFSKLACFGFISMVLFFFFLLVGFYYEWLIGGLEWD